MTKTLTGYNVMVYGKIDLKQCHICIQNVIIERKTLNDSCHKHAYSRHMSCHGYEGVMSVLCTPLQVKCYLLMFKIFNFLFFLFIFFLSILCSTEETHVYRFGTT